MENDDKALVERLRDRGEYSKYYGQPSIDGKLHYEAADRITTLLAELATVLDREAATTARYDAKVDRLEAERDAARVNDKPLTAASDNVDMWRLGEACNRAFNASAGDYIDRGLALLRELNDRGYDVVTAIRAIAGGTDADT